MKGDKRMKIKNSYVLWVVVILLITFTSVTVYIATQQSLRLGANELPATLAHELAIKLEDGSSAEQAIAQDQVDLSKSLATFAMIYDQNKNLIATSGIFNGNEPSYPKGVLDYIDEKVESRVTWQPKKGLRFASVAIKYNGGYIVAAHSLFETEKLIRSMGKTLLVVWLTGISFISLFLIGTSLFNKKGNL